MMIEPPGDFGGTGVLEVHDGVFVAVKLFFVEQGPGAVQQAGENEGDIACDPLPVKAREESGGAMPHQSIYRDRRPELSIVPFNGPASTLAAAM